MKTEARNCIVAAQFNTVDGDVRNFFLTFNNINIGQDVSPDRTKLSHYQLYALLSFQGQQRIQNQ